MAKNKKSIQLDPNKLLGHTSSAKVGDKTAGKPVTNEIQAKVGGKSDFKLDTSVQPKIGGKVGGKPVIKNH
ncbi:hypothetical protein JIN77_11660 [Verrucomicrobiaceae bacterium R5-34]|nr:hypothetical protein [Verrucomicrobiaceae bacterium R5-34]